MRCARPRPWFLAGGLTLLAACHDTSGTAAVRPVSPDRSSVEVDRASGVVADGVDPAFITITVRGTNGAPLEGRRIELEITGQQNVLDVPDEFTDEDGVVEATLASLTAETKELSVFVDEERVELDDHPTIEFVPVVALSASEPELQPTQRLASAEPSARRSESRGVRLGRVRDPSAAERPVEDSCGGRAQAAERGAPLHRSSIDALCVRSDGSANPLYRIRRAGTWSDEARIFGRPPGRGAVVWVALVARGASDQAVLVYADERSALRQVVWNGSAWETSAVASGELAIGMRFLDLLPSPTGTVLALANQRRDCLWLGAPEAGEPCERPELASDETGDCDETRRATRPSADRL